MTRVLLLKIRIVKILMIYNNKINSNNIKMILMILLKKEI